MNNKINKFSNIMILCLFGLFTVFSSMAVQTAMAGDAYIGTGTRGDRIMGTDAEAQGQVFGRDPASGDRSVNTPSRPDVNSYDQRYNFAPDVMMDVNWWNFPKPMPGPAPKPYHGVSPGTNLLPGVTGAPREGHPAADRDLPPPHAVPGAGAVRPMPGRLPDAYSRPSPGSIPGAGSRPSPGALPGEGY